MRYFLSFLNAGRGGGWPAWAALLAVLLLGAPAARAQIVDDSTKVLYGPKTTHVIYEAEVLHDSTAGLPVDTTLTKLPQTRFWFHDSTFQQDLGTVGSASRPLLYQPNLQLGARLGRNVFDKYARDAAQVPYYDSRSPYSFFRILQSTAGEQVFEISYSRSLKKNFSVGAAYERIASNKIVGTTSGAVGGVGLVEHSNLLFFGRYQTEDARYHLLVNVNTSSHRAVEQGGIRPIRSELVDSTSATDIAPSRGFPNNLLLNLSSQAVNLNQAQNAEDREQFHLFQSYRLLGRGLTAYHVLDARRQYNSYSDAAIPYNSVGNLQFYPITVPLRTRAVTLDRADYKQVENTFGVTGHSSTVEYRLYGRLRDAQLVTQTNSNILIPPTTPTGLPTPATMLVPALPKRTYNELFLGGTAAFTYHAIYAVEVAGEVKPPSLNPFSKPLNGGEYWLRGNVRTGPLAVEALLTSYSPTLTQQEFVGNHYQWYHSANKVPDNDTIMFRKSTVFANTSTQQLTGRLHQKLPGFANHLLEANLSVVNLANYVYYDSLGEPNQQKNNKQLIIGFARHRVRLGRFAFDNQATYTKGAESTTGALRIPSLVTESRAYYQSYIFGKAMFTQIGLEFYYQTKFKGYNYSPSTQQFYLQNDFTIRDYGVASAFFSADIKTVSVFLKVPYLNQGLLGHAGYFATPYYAGYPRRFQFGLNWKFFN